MVVHLPNFKMRAVFTLLFIAMVTNLTSAYTPTLARDFYNMIPINRVPYTNIQSGNVSQACTDAVSKINTETDFARKYHYHLVVVKNTLKVDIGLRAP